MSKDLATLREEAEEGTIKPEDLRQVAQRLSRADVEEDRYTMLQIVGEAGDKQYRALVERFLESPDDPMLARLALEILAHYWGEADRYLDHIRRFLRGVDWDDEDDVRQMALFQAGDYLAKNSDRELLELIIASVVDRSQNDVMRRAAYLALGRALGLEWNALPSASRVFEIDAELQSTDLLDRARRRLAGSG